MGDKLFETSFALHPFGSCSNVLLSALLLLFLESAIFIDPAGLKVKFGMVRSAFFFGRPRSMMLPDSE